MAKQLDPREFRHLELSEPTRVESRDNSEIALQGNYDATLELNSQVKRRHKVSFGEPRIYEDISWMPRSDNKRRKVSPHRDPDTRNIATIAISYKLRNPTLYFYAHDIAYYYNAYRRNAITRGEMMEIIRNIKLMG